MGIVINMRWYDDYFSTNRRMTLMDYLLANMYNMSYDDHSDIADSALDEVAPKPQPKKPTFKVVSTKTVTRNGKTYRVTVEELSIDSEEEDSEPVVEATEAEDFDEDMKEDMA